MTIESLEKDIRIKELEDQNKVLMNSSIRESKQKDNANKESLKDIIELQKQVIQTLLKNQGKVENTQNQRISRQSRKQKSK